ncbi:MAG: helix-turn-helix domain-containing protein [Pseudomonadota bacterium]|nr:helix-turn-helix domain-containing protein [Pseudomonadota bacterium]
MDAPKPNVPKAACIDRAVGLDAILANKSTSVEVQLQKTLALLRSGPMTTLDLRSEGVMMPAARIFALKNDHQYVITTELVTLLDENGYRHGRCARYHLQVGKSSDATA